MLNIILTFVMVCLFGIQHSGLSSRKVKNRIIDNWGKQGYSRLFTVTSVLALGLAFLTIPLEIWLYPLTTLPSIFLAGGILVVLGGIITYFVSKVIDVSTVADMRTDRKPELITTRIYSRIRHRCLKLIHPGQSPGWCSVPTSLESTCLAACTSLLAQAFQLSVQLTASKLFAAFRSRSMCTPQASYI